MGTWAWVALLATLVMGFGGLGALVGARRWNGLSSRYDAPVAGRAPQLDSAVEGVADASRNGTSSPAVRTPQPSREAHPGYLSRLALTQ
ncbi:MAG: Trp biosynthesis-associated membrane protein [Dermatophilaceae bacterium]